MYPISSDIDKRKLNLLGQFCRLNANSRAKDIFLLRLSSYYVSPGNRQTGYFSDICSIIRKYGIEGYLLQYFQNGTFLPSLHGSVC